MEAGQSCECAPWEPAADLDGALGVKSHKPWQAWLFSLQWLQMGSSSSVQGVNYTSALHLETLDAIALFAST